MSWYNPFHEGELSRTRPLLFTPTEPENTRRWTELVHVNLYAVAVNITLGTPSSSFKSAWISLPYTATISKTHIFRGRIK